MRLLFRQSWIVIEQISRILQGGLQITAVRCIDH